jgi:hypothetical protein
MKQKCIASISTSLAKSSRWREALQDKHPDHRNVRAAKLLAKLAGEAAHCQLSDESWQALQPYFKSERWDECLRRTSRLVGFAIKKMSFQFYIRSLVRLLSATA